MEEISKKFLKWIQDDYKKNEYNVVMLDNNNVPEEFRGKIWKICEELEENGIIKDVKPNGMPERQQIMFKLTIKGQ